MFCSRTVSCTEKTRRCGSVYLGVDKEVDRGAEILCVFGGQIGKVKGEGVKSGYRFKGLIT